MATELKLPDLGEGVEDVTVSAWRVAEGDAVSEGDIILEVATDKVDTEIPAPSSGTILKINFSEGEIAGIDAALAVIGRPDEQVESANEDVSGDQAASSGPPVDEPSTDHPSSGANGIPSKSSSATGSDVKASPVAVRVANDQAIVLDQVTGTGPGGRITKADVLAAASDETPDHGASLPPELAHVASLSVIRVAAEQNIDLDEVAAGRPLSTLTRYDVMAAVAERDGAEVVSERHLVPAGWSQSADSQSAGVQFAPSPDEQEESHAGASTASVQQAVPRVEAAGDELIKHSRMRAAVARTTSESAFTAPHVTTMWDVNMSAVLAHRKAHKGEYAQAGVNLTVTAYLIAAVIEGLKAVPAANATWTDEGVLIKRDYNVGMAVALPMDDHGMGGLIVPVIKNAGDLNLMGLARAVKDFAVRARAGQLKSADLSDGTFTLSNYGTSGSRFQTPIIVQPQVGILGVGAIEKRPVVVSQGHPLEANTGDHLAFLPMTTLGFSYDHRVLDGATADAFCAAVKQSLESWV